nr:hypothetical protein [Tanacetum cinerariifolium]
MEDFYRPSLIGGGGPGHPNTVYYSDDSDESHEDEPSEVLDIQKPIHSLSGNPTPSSDYVVESLSLLPTPFEDSDSFVEEINILLTHFNESSSDYETFCFDIKENKKSTSSTTSHYDLSLPEYEPFHFDLSIDPPPPADRSDCIMRRELTILFEENIFDTLTKDLKIHELNDFPLFLSDCDSIFSEKFYEIGLLVLFPSGNKDKVFDPRIFTINGVHSKRFSILLLDDFSSILFVRDFLFLTDPFEIETFLSFPFGNEEKLFNPGILLNNGIFSFTRKSPHLLIDNFMIDDCHILSEISLKIVSSICFHPKDKEIRGESS